MDQAVELPHDLWKSFLPHELDYFNQVIVIDCAVADAATCAKKVVSFVLDGLQYDFTTWVELRDFLAKHRAPEPVVDPYLQTR